MDQQEQVRKMNQYVSDALEGKAEVPDPYSGEILEQLQAAEKEATQIRNRIDALTNELEQLKARRTAISGISQQLAGTLARWKFNPPKVPAKNEKGDNGESKSVIDPKLVKDLEEKRKQKNT